MTKEEINKFAYEKVNADFPGAPYPSADYYARGVLAGHELAEKNQLAQSSRIGAKVDKLIAQYKESQEQVTLLKGALECVKIHYKHPMHDHNWAYYMNEIVNSALEKAKS